MLRPGLLGVSVHRLALGYVYIYIQICKVVIVGSFVPAMGNRTSSAPVDELPQSHFDNKQDDTLFSWVHIECVETENKTRRTFC